MPAKTPSRPEQSPSEGAASAKSGAGPSQTPPEASSQEASAAGEQRPKDLTSEEMALAAAQGAGDAAPSDAPPAAQAVGGYAAWQNDKRIVGLWSINQNRNSWANISGVGWKRLANNSDSAVVALTVLASHARQMQSPVNYRDEADGLIHEMYVW